MKKKHYIVSMMAVIFLYLLGIGNFHGALQANNQKTQHASTKIIKIGFPIQEGLSMKDEKGNYTGYMYDYLKELSQYTGWEYEFIESKSDDVDTQISELLDKLNKGEIDMLGSMRRSDELAKLYDYPTESYGYAYNVLAVNKDNDWLDSYTLANVKKITIALQKKAEIRNGQLKEYVKTNGLKVNYKYYNNGTAQMEAVKKGEADALLSVDIALASDFRVIARFSPDPMYFAVAKGKTKIVHDLNKGMEELNEINPTLKQTLYTKYFEEKLDHVILTQQEKDYIKKAKTFHVMIMSNQAPVQYVKGNKATGTAIDILEDIKEETGLQFSYEFVDNYHEYEERMLHHEIDILASINYDYSLNYINTMSVTNAYLKAPLQIVLQKNTGLNALDNKKLAIRKELSSILKSRIDPHNVIYANSTQDCLKAVHDGKADYMIDSSYAISYYMNQLGYRSMISVADVKGDMLNYSFGVVDGNDHMLVGILNKCIRNLKEEDINTYIYQHSLDKATFTLRDYIQQHIIESMVITLLIIICIVAVFSYFYHRQLKMKRQIEVENNRYRMLSKITQEIIFEYDYEKDILKLGDKHNFLAETNEIENYAKDISSDKKKDESSLFQCIMEMKDTDREVLIQLANKEVRWFHVVMKVVYDMDRPVYAIGRAVDIQEEKTERENLEKKSMMDALTSVYNTAAFKKKIQLELVRDKGMYAFGVLDIDYFKEVNDEFGHFIGDQVLIHCADVMQKAFGEKALIGRLGGDEFAVFLMAPQDEKAVANGCARLQKALQTTIEGLPNITLSMGFVMTKDVCDYNILYQKADKVLYEVKAAGRNAYFIKS